MGENYYAGKLHSNKLKQVYETSIPRVEQYLQAEIEFVKERLRPTDKVLELGCGYGRVLKALAPYASSLTGIDISEDSISLAKIMLEKAM